MSLAEKFDDIAMGYPANQKFFILQDLQRAFYAGAEAGMELSSVEVQDEIDRFKGHVK